MTGRFAATQDVVIHARQIIVHQGIGVNDFNRSASHRHAFGISLRQFTGGVGQQRPHAFAGAEYRVTHRRMQPLRRNVRLRQRALQKRFDTGLPGGSPGLKVGGSHNVWAKNYCSAAPKFFSTPFSKIFTCCWASWSCA